LAILTIRNLNVSYGNIRALRDASLSIEQGEIVSPIGANGAGKSTLLKALSRLIEPSSGKMAFLDKDITKYSPGQVVRLGISHSPEGRRVFPQMTVLENLMMGAYSRKVTAKELSHDLDRVFHLFPRLKEREDQIGETLSGGEQQMLAMGRALMAHPKLLLLDEPSMGLAPVVVNVIFEIIRSINAEGTAILLVEQNASMALSLATRGYVIESGAMVLDGTSAELAANPQVREAYLGKMASGS
jgi:branched-chain amino acid transport system ATP-binding protein